LISTINFDAAVKDIRLGTFQTAVLARYCGLASTPHDKGPHMGRTPIKESGKLLGKTSRQLAEMANSESQMEAAIGMAAINSLVEINDKHCRELNAGDLIGRRGTGKNIAIVGHFPFIPALRKLARHLWVLEQNPQDGDIQDTEADNILPRADIVGITGTAITNKTIEHLLELCESKAFVVILGGTAPMSPVLFDYGVDAVSGTRVLDTEMVLQYVSQGATYRQIEGVRRLTLLKDGTS
jgi:uncharacterized protein